ncbi:MAG: oxygenase MpaB family protein [Chloroflexi bacterium]|nr:oxygenase MpaB family protein [Chloroflexota bacterium]
MTLVKEVCPVAQRIWQSPDAIMLFFAGGAAEFAAIKAVDWLFFTGALPDDPVGRFFETVRFAQRVFYSDPAQAVKTIQTINRIHRQVEADRGYVIPPWAYRDVLFIILDYGERAHTVVYGPLSMAERVAYFEAVLALGQAMELADLPATYADYQAQRHQQLIDDYAHTPLTDELFTRYRVALGPWRYWLLRRVQACLVPDEVRTVLALEPEWLTKLFLRMYRHLPGGGNKLRWLHSILLPRSYTKQLRTLAMAYTTGLVG